MSATETAPGNVTKGDVEAKLRQIQAQLGSQVERVQPKLYALGAVLAVAGAVAAYLIGRRKGRLASTVVEIRRV
ncbi:MAG: hypothetical protein ACRDYD_13840 [Acidimicrobiales bacterium]